MYIPSPHAETDAETLFAFIAANPLGALVTVSAGGELVGTHIPWVLQRGQGEHGALQGHIAKSNLEHRATSGSTPDQRLQALVIFTGPDAYISPSWYASKREHGKVVPTWNYVAVHVIGKVRFTSDQGFLAGHLEQLVATYEGALAAPWTIRDAPSDYIERQMHGIIGVEVTIDRIEGKWKMSQNRPAADIVGVVENLGNSERAKERAVGEIVAARNAAKLNGA